MHGPKYLLFQLRELLLQLEEQFLRFLPLGGPVCGTWILDCSLCAKLRRGALSTEMNRLGLNKIALGHHYDDAVETMVMSLFLEGRIGFYKYQSG